MVDVTGTKGFFQTVLELLLWYVSVMMLSWNLTLQYDPIYKYI